MAKSTSPCCLLRCVAAASEEAERGKDRISGTWALLELRQKCWHDGAIYRPVLSWVSWSELSASLRVGKIFDR